ncbi:S8 family serine peptidase [Streptomyces albidoflavus]
MPFLRPTVAAIATAALAAGTLSVSALPAAAAPAPQPVAADKLGAHDRALIKQYQQQSRARSAQPDALRATPDFVTLIVAVQEGRTAAVAEEIAALGAEVTRTDAEVGYVKVNAPFATVDALLALDGVVAVDADELLQLEDVRPDGELTGKGHGGKGGSGARKLPAGPSAKTPDANPYMPTGETGSADFKKRHKTYDGRGVTIGIMDSGVDPTHPALAKTTTGERKLVDTVTGTDPNNFIDMLFDNTWQLVSRQVSGPKYTDPDTRNVWTLPEEEGLRFSAKTNTLPNGFTGKIGVLHRDGDDAVRVDTDGDLDFTDEELMRPYAEKHQVGFLGKDDPATGINESVPFTVQVKRDMLSSSVIGVALNYIDVAHGTHVAGITAAHGMFGGKMDGQAPGAKLVSMRACHSLGCSSAALTDGMIDLAHDHGVDVINMSIGSSPEFNDGQSARALVYNRLVKESGVQLFISGGNSGANTIGDPTAADQVVSVGASVSADTYWANYGSEVKAKRDIFPFSSRGPREDGGFKPDITAPGSAVAPTPSWIAPTSVAETGYTLPAGYSMMNGTSMASPQATGAAALLLSAAGQKRLAPSPAELRAAIYSSAAPIRGVTAIAQGRGQFDVAGAWKHLEKRNGTGDAVTVSAPVCTPLSGQLVTPHTGSGVFNSCAPTTGGQKPGELRTYEVTLTRTSGKAGSAPYKLRAAHREAGQGGADHRQGDREAACRRCPQRRADDRQSRHQGRRPARHARRRGRGRPGRGLEGDGRLRAERHHPLHRGRPRGHQEPRREALRRPRGQPDPLVGLRPDRHVGGEGGRGHPLLLQQLLRRLRLHPRGPLLHRPEARRLGAGRGVPADHAGLLRALHSGGLGHPLTPPVEGPGAK